MMYLGWMLIRLSSHSPEVGNIKTLTKHKPGRRRFLLLCVAGLAAYVAGLGRAAAGSPSLVYLPLVHGAARLLWAQIGQAGAVTRWDGGAVWG